MTNTSKNTKTNTSTNAMTNTSTNIKTNKSTNIKTNTSTDTMTNKFKRWVGATRNTAIMLHGTWFLQTAFALFPHQVKKKYRQCRMKF